MNAKLLAIGIASASAIVGAQAATFNIAFGDGAGSTGGWTVNHTGSGPYIYTVTDTITGPMTFTVNGHNAGSDTSLAILTYQVSVTNAASSTDQIGSATGSIQFKSTDSHLSSTKGLLDMTFSANVQKFTSGIGIGSIGQLALMGPAKVGSTPNFLAGSYNVSQSEISNTLGMVKEGKSGYMYSSNGQFGAKLSPVPEPTSMATLALGAMGILIRRRRIQN